MLCPIKRTISKAERESCSGSDEETPSGEAVGPACPQCGAEFRGYPELAEHSKLCLLGEDGGKTDEARRQDAENNNSLEEEEQIVFPFGSPGHVTLEALQNTKVAVAQFAATAMANNADNPAALQELAVLQSTLYTLQHQQMMQLNLIQQLQQQLQITRPKDSTPPPMVKRSRSPTPVTVKPESPPAPTPTPPPAVTVPPQPSPPVSLPPCSISSSFASSIITNLDPPPSPSEPNTLEMLQRRAQEVLDNASQGLLANNLADELAFRKNGSKGGVSPYDSRTGGRNEPFFKHRCRYCGKVFGSDSALQIHIRSHTGERPFKCNVCGSRFTTKGNLKVHFQRHSAKFPHIKMNPNPVPEHLDKYHPPLLAQMGAHQSLPPGPPPFPPQFTPLYRPPHDLVLPPQRTHEPVNKPILPVSVFGPRIEQEVPENLSSKAPDQTSPEQEYKKEPTDEEPREDRLSPKREVEAEGELERYPSPPGYDDCSLDSKYTGEDIPGDRDSPGMEKNEDSFQDQPENLSNKSTSDLGHLSLTPDHRFQQSVNFPNIASPPSSTSSGSVHRLTPRGFLPNEPDPIKDPAIYSSLLPRPGSTDNSWESLIEITKTSETHKLQQLVDNIENKLTDPNQCVICHRVLSCKSALQMHYRTHTGERPFRCKICGRAFTTKGNLKTHMGVHRIKPPMRMLHQCPVCHKKFTNGLVLQQHIRLHTGEPTDLTPEQIQAAEIKEFVPHPNFPIHFPPISQPSPSPKEEKNDYAEEVRASSLSPISDAAFSTSITALENQVRTITTIASHYIPSKFVNDSDDMSSNKDYNPITVNGDMKSPGQSPRSGSESGPSPATLQLTRESPAASESSSLGALDLTPRSSSAMFPAFFPPASGAPLITSALSSLTSSVLTTTAFNPLGLAVGPPVRGNTTCNLCFKTFACNSALEIHYRSHTKERPFKCTICDRGFSTKGNMKQHMLTHKIRDMPPHLFEQKQGGGTPSATVLNPEGNLNPSVQQPQQQPILQQPQPLQNQQQTPPQPSQPPQPVQQAEVEPARPPSPQQKIELGVKRSPPQGDTPAMPLPKRQPSLPKHLCHVCNKNFSSSSALQIHMRTHTGDKPFRCSICHKAFTTKGNLKVHMGTHMWTNGASRRGRRMSLELPQLPKDTEFLHRRPDLFYPYLPAPFLNGIHQKLSEMPMGGGGGGSHNGMMSFGGFPSEMKGEPRSPEKPPHSGATPPSLWDLHFERKPEEQAMPPPPRGEGLAA
ncbi:homeotic protein spalt-major isoform X3 [Halyomorpha halys]|uniref:homeotic protein spalt-major isoform X3 n=1 Tax=Halyomorpha halys TaxID=286706 RepID=UPI0006D4FDCA